MLGCMESIESYFILDILCFLDFLWVFTLYLPYFFTLCMLDTLRDLVDVLSRILITVSHLGSSLDYKRHLSLSIILWYIYRFLRSLTGILLKIHSSQFLVRPLYHYLSIFLWVDRCFIDWVKHNWMQLDVSLRICFFKKCDLLIELWCWVNYKMSI